MLRFTLPELIVPPSGNLLAEILKSRKSASGMVLPFKIGSPGLFRTIFEHESIPLHEKNDNWRPLFYINASRQWI